jgi:molybdopterin-guanine dinucleotide biosynthesis protein A
MTQPAAAFEEVTGAILIGGKSRRLGRDKILLPYEGKPLVLHMYELLNGLFPRTLHAFLTLSRTKGSSVVYLQLSPMEPHLSYLSSA